RLVKSTNGGLDWLDTGLLDPNAIVVRVDPVTPDTVIVGTSQAVWRSENAGLSWEHDDLLRYYVLDLALVATAPSPVFAATNNGLYRSDDGGLRWNALALDEFPSHIVSSPGGDTLYTTTGITGVFRSTSGGATWTPAVGGLQTLGIADLARRPGKPTQCNGPPNSGATSPGPFGVSGWTPAKGLVPYRYI